MAQTADAMLDGVRLFAAEKLRPLARELDSAGRFPAELLGDMRSIGLFGLNYPMEFGGGGYDSVATHQAMSEIARVSAGVALTLHVHYMAVDVLLRFGTSGQKQKYLNKLIAGEQIAAFTISEGGAGSDAAAIKAVAVADGTGWLLNGTKYFCTNGGLADLYFVAFKTDPAAGAKGISLFIIEKGATGFSIGACEEKMGCRSSVTTGLVFSNCHVPAENMLGLVNEGFKLAMFGLTGGRLGMASMGLGIAEAALAEAATYANQRQAFGKPLTALYAVQEMLADMYVAMESCRLMVNATAALRDSGRDYSLETSVVKLQVARAATEICHKAVQILGGHGYMKHNPLERYARDVRLMDIGVGASEVLKMVVGGAVARQYSQKPTG